MPRARTPRRATRTKRTIKKTKPGVWSGTGLCAEAQGDGVPCRGVDGECETCGRAIAKIAARH